MQTRDKRWANKKIKVLELFAGIGATSKALKNLGYDLFSTHIELNKKSIEVSNLLWDRQDRPHDVRNFKEKDYKFDLLVAGFPCQPFSNAGKKQGFNDEKGRGDLYKEVLRIIKDVKPTHVILENVKGIMQEKHKWIVLEIEKKLKRMGYHTHTQIINAKYYIPQNRERVFIIGSLKKQPQPIIEPKNRTTIVKDYLDKKIDPNSYITMTQKQKDLIFSKNWVGIENKKFKGRTDIYKRYWKDNSKYIGSVPRMNQPKLLEQRTNIKGLFYETFNQENYLNGERERDRNNHRLRSK